MRLDSSYSVFTLLLALFVFLAALPSYAQDESVGTIRQSPMPTVAAQAQKAGEPPVRSMPPQAIIEGDEITVLRDNYAGKYNTATLEDLSKMYWRLGAFDLADNLAIGNYIKINDCKVFTDFINDDMEWSKIVDTMRGHLQKSRGTFPLNFQFVIEVHLGRYDPVQGGFPLVDNTGFKDATRISVDSIDNRREICFDDRPIEDYPRSVLILLPEPFTLDFIKLDEHVAQAYILRKKAEFNKLEEAVRVKRYERNAFLRLRVTFTQYHGNLRGDQNAVLSILYGNIDGYELFEDASQKRLMLSVDTKDIDTSMMSLPALPVEKQTEADKAKQAIKASGFELMPHSNAMPVSHSFAP